ncbi:DUF6766 family protein [Streptomyces virginiae]|uniref:DUF6766 family protein n=1 Tax=Streptomyces virginiae TaxID=1961 RepID=UPI00068C5513
MKQREKDPRRGFWRDNSLTLAFGGAFLLVLAGQAVAGHAGFNEDLAVDGMQQLTLGEYLMSSDFAVDLGCPPPTRPPLSPACRGWGVRLGGFRREVRGRSWRSLAFGTKHGIR